MKNEIRLTDDQKFDIHEILQLERTRLLEDFHKGITAITDIEKLAVLRNAVNDLTTREDIHE